VIHFSHRSTSASKNAAWWKSCDCYLSHFRASVSTSASSVKQLPPPSCEPLYATNTSHRKQEIFLYQYPFSFSPFAHKEGTTMRYYTHQERTPFWILKPASEHAQARLLFRLSWSWYVLLSSDTNRKPITSITAVLLPFVTYLLIVPRNFVTLMRKPNITVKWVAILLGICENQFQVSSCRPAIVTELFVVSLFSSRKIPIQYLRLAHRLILRYPFHFIR
jgi:hypothetical protein